jgi:dethiobiotin synthetase
MMTRPIFISGIGTEVGKTVVSAILTEGLHADYWKPVQAGFYDGTDALTIEELISNSETVIHPEVYKLSLAASPHIAARLERMKIDLNLIASQFHHLQTSNRQIIIEGAGGLMVPLNKNDFVIDLIQKLNARVILVSRNYLGSINHSLLTAAVCKQKNIDVVGWIFNDQYMDYEHEIVQWSGLPKICSIPFSENVTKEFIKEHAEKIKESLQELL